MTEENTNDTWEVEVGGQVYQASFDELPEWISEGSLQPTDKVRKGNRNWIFADRVPALMPFFSAKARGEQIAMPPQVHHQIAEATPAASVITPPTASVESVVRPRTPAPKKKQTDSAFCSIHGDRETVYICSGCGHSFCKTCPSSYGGNVRICPDCGQMCNSQKELLASKESYARQSEPFGFGDFVNALGFPFRFMSSLVFGSIMFAIFTLGQSVRNIGGIFLGAIALLCVLLANMMTFGVLANTVDNFAKGSIDEDFMPRFDDFNLWDDMVHPFFLSIAAYLVSFGPFIVSMVIIGYMIFSSIQAKHTVFKEQVAQTPGTEFYAPDRTAEQSEEVQRLLGEVRDGANKRLQQQSSIENGNTDISTTTTDDAKLASERLDEIKAKIEPPPLNGAELFAKIYSVAAPFFIFSVIALLWALFFYPAACAVGGYTRSFFATINPAVGLDTIRRLGFDYVKVLIMCLLLSVALIVVITFFTLILSPFNLPILGNIPAILAASIVTFYFFTVFSCILGYALFKASDRLKLPK